MKKNILIAVILLAAVAACDSVYAKIDKKEVPDKALQNNTKQNSAYFCKEGQSYKYDEENGKMKIIQVEVKNNPCASSYDNRRYIENRMLEDMHPSKIVPPMGNFIR